MKYENSEKNYKVERKKENFKGLKRKKKETRERERKINEE